MFEPLRFAPEIESQVRFVEETPPAAIIGETVRRLEDGAEPRGLLRAAALAVLRSTELPAGHHGGPVHPINGLHGCLATARRLSGASGYLPVVQHVALCNHHVRSPHMGPYIMPALEPRGGYLDRAFDVFHDLESSIVHMGGPDDDACAEERDEMGDGPEQLLATRRAFVKAVEDRRPAAAEQCLLWLLERQSLGEVLDLLVPFCVARNHLDDHNFLYPILSAMALEDIGAEWAPVLLRSAVRYHARAPSDIRDAGDPGPDYPALIEAAIEKIRPGRQASRFGKQRGGNAGAGCPDRSPGRGPDIRRSHRPAGPSPRQRPLARRGRGGALGGRLAHSQPYDLRQPDGFPPPHRRPPPGASFCACPASAGAAGSWPCSPA